MRMWLCEFVCERRSDRHRLAVAVDGVMLVLLEREHADTALVQFLVDDVRDERDVLHVTRRLGQSQGEVPRELNVLGANHQQVAVLPLDLLDADLLDGLRLKAVLPALVRVDVADIVDVRVRELGDIEDGVELVLCAHDVVVGEE